eukprot:4341589-Amphidinium_carterae.1
MKRVTLLSSPLRHSFVRVGTTQRTSKIALVVYFMSNPKEMSMSKRVVEDGSWEVRSPINGSGCPTARKART